MSLLIPLFVKKKKEKKEKKKAFFPQVPLWLTLRKYRRNEDDGNKDNNDDGVGIMSAKSEALCNIRWISGWGGWWS
jgi:hypothetical protein